MINSLPFFEIKSESSFFPKNIKPDEDGLIFIGGDLSPSILIEAYSRGIFPWFSKPYVHWFSPDPRMVLFPEEFHLSKSMKKLFHNQSLSCKYNTAFLEVIQNCSQTIRKTNNGTWISPDFIDAYYRLHKMKIAHSVEIYENGILCGGLYGIAIGKVFFGESMFTHKPNFSKLALYNLCQTLSKLEFSIIDCQVHTNHLESLGAKEISRDLFLNIVSQNINE